MSDDSLRTDGLADVINLLAAPIASGLRTVEQVRRGVDELFRAVENLNRTMASLNESAERVNRLLAEVEGPVRAMMPQLTRTIRTADEITQRLEGPVRATAPNIERLVTTLSSPSFATLPNQLGDFMNAIGDVSRRLGPLASLAENAGGIFGAFKIPGMSTASKPPTPSRDEPVPAQLAATEKTEAEKTTAKQPATRKSTAKKASTRKTPAKNTAAKKATTATRKTAARRR